MLPEQDFQMPQYGQYHPSGAYTHQPWQHQHKRRYSDIFKPQDLQTGYSQVPYPPPNPMLGHGALPFTQNPMQQRTFTHPLSLNPACLGQSPPNLPNLTHAPLTPDELNVIQVLPPSPGVAENGWIEVFDNLRHAQGPDPLPARRGLAALRHAGVLPDETPAAGLSSYYNHDRSPSGPRKTEQRRMHQCPYCKRTFRLPNGLAIHLKWHWKGNSKGGQSLSYLCDVYKMQTLKPLLHSFCSGSKCS